MLKKLVKMVKGNLEYSKAIIKDSKNVKSSYSLDQVNESGYIFSKNSFEVTQAKSSFAICRFVLFGNLFLNKKVPLITVDILFDKLSKDSREFVIQHELGHFNLGHLNDITLERDFTKEVDADKYAANIVGKDVAIKAIKEMIDIAKEINPLYDSTEFESRLMLIEAL